jgi:hypothetical protein
MPRGLRAVVGLWDHACSYAPVNKPYAICNVPTNSHSWQPAASDHGSFVCAKVTNDPKPNASIFVDRLAGLWTEI